MILPWPFVKILIPYILGLVVAYSLLPGGIDIGLCNQTASIRTAETHTAAPPKAAPQASAPHASAPHASAPGTAVSSTAVRNNGIRSHLLLAGALLIPLGWTLLQGAGSRQNKRFSLKPLRHRNLALLAGLAGLGAIRAVENAPADSAHLYTALFVATVKEPPETKSRSIKIAAHIDWSIEGETTGGETTGGETTGGETTLATKGGPAGQGNGKRLRAVNELWILYLQPDSNALRLRPGDRMLFRALPSRLTDEKNPFAFGAGSYAKRKGFRASAWLGAGNWLPWGTGRRYWALRRAGQFRDRWLTLMRHDGVTERDLALIGALSLGYKEALNEEVRNNFSVTGLAHLLAVSGMNTVLVIAFPLWLLRKWRQRRLLSLWLTAATLLLLWAYACVVGLSPSVCRSVTMFSLLLLGNGLRKKGQAANILAASAFLWLWFQPLQLFDVGFLLSHLAVASIVCFYPLYVKTDAYGQPRDATADTAPEMESKIESESESKSEAYLPARRVAASRIKAFLHNMLKSFAGWFGSFLNLTLSVQPGTLPLSVALFGNLPLWLLPANLWAVPLVSLVVYGTMFHGICAFIAPLRRLIARAIGSTTSLLYNGVETIAAWPGSQQQFYVSGALLCCIWGLVFGLAWLKHARRKGAPLLMCLVMVIIAQGIRTSETGFRKPPKGVILYASNRGAFAHFIGDTRNILYSHDTTAIARKEQKRLSDPVARRYHLAEATRLSHSDSLWHEAEIGFSRNGSLFRLGDLTLVMCHTYPSPFGKKELQAPFTTDILWIGTDPRHNLGQLCRNLKPRLIVIANNVPGRVREKWEATSAEYGCKLFVQQRDGAYISIK